MGGNIPGGNILGGNFPGGSLMGGNFPGGNFPGENFPRTFNLTTGGGRNSLYSLRDDTSVIIKEAVKDQVLSF